MSKRSILIPCTVFVLSIFCSKPLAAQAGSLSLPATATSGGTASLEVALGGGSQPAALQWTVAYSSSAVTAINVTAGPSLTGAGKSLSCSGGPGAYTCVATGLNATAIADGVVATANLTFAPSASMVNVGLTNTMGASAAGGAIPISGTGSSVVVTPVATLSSAACNPSSLVTPGTTGCTATLSAPAPAGGALVALKSNSASLTVPASITVLAGAASGTFTANAATAPTNQTATITATLAGNSVSATLSLAPPAPPPVTMASLACSPSSISPGASTACTVILTGAAPAGGAVVALTSNNSALAVPSSLTVPAGSTSTTFAANAGTVAATQTAAVTASLGGSSLTNSIVLNPAGGPPALEVGPGRTYATPCQAATVAPDGALIKIDANGTYSGDACTINANNITLKGINGRPRVDAAGQSDGSKGTWVFEGDNITVDTIELSGAAAPGNNGAAIRMEGKNLTVLNSYIHDNQEGILVNPQPSAQILVQSTEFNHNGSGDGLTHNLHVSAAARLTLQYSYSHNGNAGNLVETGASENYIQYNRLTSEAGATSVELDISRGGRSFVIGNLIEKGPNDQRESVLGYLSAGSTGNSASTELYVVNNTFVTDRVSGATFLDINAADPTPAVVVNNIFCGPGTVTTQNTAVLNANLTSDPQFANRAGYDYRLTPGSPAINAGVNPGTAAGFSLTPLYEHVSPVCAEGRNPVGAVDIGAYEFGGAGAQLACSIGTSALSLTPNSIIGGGSTTATVTLSNPAPPSGAPIVLSSSDSSLVPLPAGITIPSGAISASFAVPTAFVPNAATVTVSASYGGATQTASLTLLAPALSLQCNPTSLQSGAAATCTVALNLAAPAGGATISLASNSSLLTTPGSVVMAPGSSSATFNATAGAVGSNQAASVTATLSGVSKSVAISLVAPAVLSSLACSPTSLSTGGASSCLVTLSMAAPAGGTVIALSDNSTLLTTPAAVTVGAGSSTVTFSVTAGTIGSSQSVTVSATLNGISRTAVLNLTPPATLSALACSPTSLNSGATSVCTVTLTSAAAKGGVTVSLSDNSSSLTTPSSVAIAAGSTSAKFSVTAGRSIRRSTNATLTATLGTTSRSVTLHLSR